MKDAPESDLLYGIPAIAAFLGMNENQARNRHDRKQIPTFKLTGTVCARRSTLTAWIAEQEAKAQTTPAPAPAPVGPAP